ncbi:hypothetical protein MMC07_009296 [Pseudocyphellaria aurata]|nr:hypothetical protein [Pseudocyphellaria aurata]
MKFLCLHGGGTSAAIFKSQTASFRSRLDSTFSFDFVDAPYPATPAAGIELFYPPPYYKFYHGTGVSVVRAAHNWLRELFARDGPYDGVMLFSQGCSLISSFLMYHQVETPHLPLPFKVAIFICGGIPLSVVEDLGIVVSQEARDLDARTGKQLQQRASAVATAAPGTDYWIDVDERLFDPSALIEPSNVFGLDFTKIKRPLISIPTVHIYGGKDPRFPASVQLAHFCEPTMKRTYDHGGGHDIPRTKEVSETIAELVRWSAFMSKLGEDTEFSWTTG